MSHLPIRKTVPLVKSAISAVAKRTTAMVLTAGGRTTPRYAVKRGLLTIRSVTRTVTAMTATVVIYATAMTSATTRSGSIATGTICIS